MHDDQPPRDHRDEPTSPRRPWIAPAVRRFNAGDAENGVTNNIADGTFAYSS